MSVAAHFGNSRAKGGLFLKTKLCKFNAMGMCARGSDCKFAHGDSELSKLPDFSKTEFCPVLLRTGMCPDGATCRFAHAQEELRPRVAERSLSSEAWSLQGGSAPERSSQQTAQQTVQQTAQQTAQQQPQQQPNQQQQQEQQPHPSVFFQMVPVNQMAVPMVAQPMCAVAAVPLIQPTEVMPPIFAATSLEEQPSPESGVASEGLSFCDIACGHSDEDETGTEELLPAGRGFGRQSSNASTASAAEELLAEIAWDTKVKNGFLEFVEEPAEVCRTRRRSRTLPAGIASNLTWSSRGEDAAHEQ